MAFPGIEEHAVLDNRKESSPLNDDQTKQEQHRRRLLQPWSLGTLVPKKPMAGLFVLLHHWYHHLASCTLCFLLKALITPSSFEIMDFVCS